MIDDIFDLSKLGQLERGRAEKHLNAIVRYGGVVMRASAMYVQFSATHKRIIEQPYMKRVLRDWGSGRMYEKQLAYRTVHGLARSDQFLDIPKILYKVCLLDSFGGTDE